MHGGKPLDKHKNPLIAGKENTLSTFHDQGIFVTRSSTVLHQDNIMFLDKL